jgi:hypothetical protein
MTFERKINQQQIQRERWWKRENVLCNWQEDKVLGIRGIKGWKAPTFDRNQLSMVSVSST